MEGNIMKWRCGVVSKLPKLIQLLRFYGKSTSLIHLKY